MRARVWNDNQSEYTEMFKGELIRIAPKQFVEMEASEANDFLGQFTPILRDAQGRDLRPKMLRKEFIQAAKVEEKPTFICQKDGSIWPSQEALDSHIRTNFQDSIIEEEGREKLKGKKK